jgi:hypothetical protein
MKPSGFSSAGMAVAMLALSSASGQKPAQRVVLVELFTSEGCSSCPPADALLRKLDGSKTSDGTLMVALGEHVTYWNSFGWADRFSAETYTARQQSYGERFRLDSVYTPQIVVNGQAQVLGSDESAVRRAVAAQPTNTITLQLAQVVLAGDHLQVSYSLRGVLPDQSEVWAAVTDDRATTEVKSGENGGRRLEHAAVARSLVRLGPALTGDSSESIKIPPVLAGQETSRRHLIVFVQEAPAGKILAVESRPL